jgi:hypothetical protein
VFVCFVTVLLCFSYGFRSLHSGYLKAQVRFNQFYLVVIASPGHAFFLQGESEIVPLEKRDADRKRVRMVYALLCP